MLAVMFQQSGLRQRLGAPDSHRRAPRAVRWRTPRSGRPSMTHRLILQVSPALQRAIKEVQAGRPALVDTVTQFD